ncbi:MAG: 2-phosphosulfolactate phosphatase [Myxococcota bacterium]|nr:2-phosphosulfolactate phosphatase [Myxococcota bacterium]
MTDGPFSQAGARARLEWGRRGAALAAERGDLLVVVDVLSFSSAVSVAMGRGAVILPCDWSDDPFAVAERERAVAAVRRERVPEAGRYSLSPPTLEAASPGERIVLASPNGATCARRAGEVRALYAASLLNAKATAAAVRAELAADPSLCATVLACGERHKDDHEDGPLRFALEDWLGAGAVLSGLGDSLSPEARAAALSFEALRGEIANTLHECGSGRELRAAGYPEDPASAACLDAIGVAARFEDRAFRPFDPFDSNSGA